ncbi:hypothetical protein PCE1_000263 [Barthelona sp. PCE]
MSDDYGTLYRVYKTVLEMLEARGYVVDEQKMEVSLDDFMSLASSENALRSDLSEFTFKADNQDDNVVVLFTTETVTSKYLDGAMKLVDNNNSRRCIIVTKNERTITSKVRDKIRELQGARPERNFVIEVFKESQLVINITKHSLVPTHIPLTEEQTQEVLDKYKVEKFQLPRIKKDDPVARFLGLAKMQVVRIERPSETAGRYVSYRVVW